MRLPGAQINTLTDPSGYSIVGYCRAVHSRGLESW
jgi:hypothetical protein